MKSYKKDVFYKKEYGPKFQAELFGQALHLIKKSLMSSFQIYAGLDLRKLD
jgi:hypothetical protein